MRDVRRKKNRSGIMKHISYLGDMPVVLMLSIAKLSAPKHQVQSSTSGFNQHGAHRDQEAVDKILCYYTLVFALKLPNISSGITFYLVFIIK